MDKNKKHNSDFLVQGSILAIASIISRIIGMIYRIPLTNIIGDDGNNIYGSAFEIYNILLLISSYSVPSAVSKLVASRIALNQKKNAMVVFRGALFISAVTGSVACFLVLGFTDFFTAILATPQAYLALRVLGPTLLIVAIMGVIRGFFQGLGTMVPSAVSQIIEQIVNAVVSIAAAYVLFSYGARVGKVLGNEDAYSASYGAAGGTLGTGFGAAASLVFLIIIFIGFFRKKDKSYNYSIEKDVKTETFRSIFGEMMMTIFPILLSTVVYNVSGIVDQIIFKNMTLFLGYGAAQVSTWWGVWYGKYKVLINIPIGIASAMATSAMPSITVTMHSGSRKDVNRKINSSIRFIMLIVFPITVGLAVLGSPILQLLFHDARPLGAIMLIVGAPSVVFYSISTLTNAALQGIDRLMEPIKNAFYALVLHVVVLFILIFCRANIYSVVLANVAFSYLMCMFNNNSLRRYSKYRQHYRRAFILPLICSLVMGVLVLVSYKLLMLACGRNSISTLLAVLIGIVSYIYITCLFHGVTEREILSFPGGAKAARFLKKIHALR